MLCCIDKKCTLIGFGEGVTASCHGIIKAAETMVAALGVKAVAVVVPGGKVVVADSRHKILTRSFVNFVMLGGG